MSPPSPKPAVSVIIPVRNGLPYLDECLGSLLGQETAPDLLFEVAVYNDASDDRTQDYLDSWSAKFAEKGIAFRCGRGERPGGVGYAKNRAVQLSSGRFLCFCDADDFSFPRRIQTQYDWILRAAHPELTICGSGFVRNDERATVRYTKWANELSDSQLVTQHFTSHGPTVIAPTWFLARSLYDEVGGFNEEHRVGHPEDLEFFLEALKLGSAVVKVPECLVMYRYHPNCATFSVDERTIWAMRIRYIEDMILGGWKKLTIWNAGKQGKKFYKSLSTENRGKSLSVENRGKVVAFCDVDSSKIRHGKYEVYDEVERKVTSTIPVISHEDAQPPVVICVKLDLTNGEFERLLRQKHWIEGRDYFHFS
uniref:Glyco_trans_2-like domain-containing protein n=1 Tax=Steinernema glaseri TaxID=37863 RepID=A0A1I7ZW16_9BILA